MFWVLKSTVTLRLWEYKFLITYAYLEAWNVYIQVWSVFTLINVNIEASQDI